MEEERNDIRLVYKVLADKNMMHLEDELFDAGLVGLARGIKTYDETKDITRGTYYYTCIENEINNAYKTSIRKKRGEGKKPTSLSAEIGEDGDVLEDIIGDNTNIEEDIINKMRVEAIKKEIAKLKPKTQRAMNLYFFEGLGSTEIAKIMGVSRMMVNTRINEGINKIKVKLKEWE